MMLDGLATEVIQIECAGDTGLHCLGSPAFSIVHGENVFHVLQGNYSVWRTSAVPSRSPSQKRIAAIVHQGNHVTV